MKFKINFKKKQFIFGTHYLSIIIFAIFIFSLGMISKFSIFQPTETFTIFREGFFQSQPNIPEVKFKKEFLIIVDKSQVTQPSERELKNLIDIFDFSKIEYDIKSDIDPQVDYSSYSNIILLKKDYLGFDKRVFNEIKETVLKGTTLYFFGGNNEFNPFMKFLGIRKVDGVDKVKKINFKDKFYPGIGIITDNENLTQSDALKISELDPEADVIAESSKGIPIYYEMKKELGRVVYINTNLHENYYMQGLLKQLISYGSNYFVSPFLNGKVIQIDDFPFPVQGKAVNIMKDYGLSNEDFIKSIWLPDMKKVQEELNVKFTTFLIFDYGVESTESEIKNKLPVDLRIASEQGRMALNMGMEIGIHGYNHNPLAMGDEIDYTLYSIYSPWESIDAMILSQERFKRNLENIFKKGFKVHSYVAPNNLLGVEGKEALKTSFPEMKSICGVFAGEEHGERGLLSQKVGVDPNFPNFYSFPRFSAGYDYNAGELANIFNGVAAYGYVSHFIHPDDIFANDTRTFTKSWKVMFGKFYRLISEINKEFFFLEPMYQLDLAKSYSNIEKIQLEIVKKDDVLEIKTHNYIDSFQTEVRLRGEEIESVTGGEFKLIHKDNKTNLYLVKIQNNVTELKLKKNIK